MVPWVRIPPLPHMNTINAWHLFGYPSLRCNGLWSLTSGVYTTESAIEAILTSIEPYERHRVQAVDGSLNFEGSTAQAVDFLRDQT